MSKQHGYVDGRTSLPVFIDRELDDLGLDPYQFRIYARIARRAGERGAFESIRNMAIACQMSESKVKSSLKLLLDCHLVIKESRTGDTSVYRLTDKSEWLRPEKSELRSKRGYGKTPDITKLPTPDITELPTPDITELGVGHNETTTPDITELQRYSIEDTPVKGTPIEELIPPIPPVNSREGDEAIRVEAEIVAEEINQASLSSVQPEIMSAFDQPSLSIEVKVPARENCSQIQKINRIKEIFEETGKVLNYGIEYQQWIHAEMGDVIKHYRQSARALDRTPNDISLEFKSHVSIRANNGKGLDIHSVERWIVNCEKTPDRWPELRSLVAGWLLTKQTGDRYLNIAQEVERSSRPPISLNLNF